MKKEEEGTSKKTPRTVKEQDAPEPERLTTPAEEAGESLQELENPPQAEGPREEGSE